MRHLRSRDPAAPPSRFLGKAFVASALGLSVTLGWIPVAHREAVAPEREITHRPIQALEGGHASSDTCRACHPSQYATWRSSYHRSMTQVATPQTVVANFDGVSVESVHGTPMHLNRRGREFWAAFDDPDWNGTGGAPPRVERQVVMTTGSHHQQVYWYATGQSRLLGQLPGIYLIADERWVPRRTAFVQPPTEPLFSETGHWNSTCIACHTTNGRSLLAKPPGSTSIDTQVADTRVAEFGIACEACHGPSVRHADQNRSPFRRYWLHLTGQPDPTTVQPRRLSQRQSSQVCGQCHSVWEFYDSEAERLANAKGPSYRPGDELTGTRLVAQPTRNVESPSMQALLARDPGFLRDSFWSDGMVRVTGREYNGLLDSPCFQNATDDKRTLSCLSCHNMHQTADDPRRITEWAADQLAPRMNGNDACLQCHERFRPDATTHTRHRSDSAGSFCYNCHMPHTTYGLLKTTRSHRVSTPSVAESISTGRPNACNLCHMDKTLAWTSGHLKKWFSIPPVELSDDERSIAASVLWALRGDAGQRAIIAQGMSWQAAQQASGTDWMVPYAGLLLDDPYAAVRFIAYRSLRTLSGFGTFKYDFNAPRQQRLEATAAALAEWRRTLSESNRRTDPELLFDSQGLLQADTINRLRGQRDTRRVVLRE